MTAIAEKTGIQGQVHAVLRGPSQHVRAHLRNGKMIGAHDRLGRIKAECTIHNLVTAVGDQYYASRGAPAGSPDAAITGMKLGTGSTAPAKTGAGAALVTYLTTSNKALDGGFPTAVAGVATYKRTYAAGEATSASAITEVVLVNDTIATNATSAAANTISRALLTGIGSKGALDTLTVTWTHTLLGA